MQIQRMLFHGYLATFLAVKVWAGYEMTASINYERPARDGIKQEALLAKYYIDKEKGRFEFTKGSIPTMAMGTYLITKDGGLTMILVDPVAGTYMEWDLDQLLGTANSAFYFMNAQVINPKTDKVADEVGPSLLGHPTRHYKFVSSYGLEFVFMNMKQLTQIEQEIEIWIAPTLSDAVFNPWARQQNPKTGIEQVDILIEKMIQQVKGFPLKQITANKTVAPSGRTRISRTSMEITEIVTNAIPAELFVVPSGYTRRDPSSAKRDDHPIPDK